MTGLVADSRCREHDPGTGHPECPERFDAVVGALREAGLMETLAQLPARDAAGSDLRLCHASDYLRLAEHEIREGMPELSTGDTAICERSWDATLRAAGSALAAVDAVVSGIVENAFCVVRPPGHHASESRGMGFCVVNNIAIAARHAQRRHGIERVLIADWDVHHGNGTHEIFYDDPSIFFFSTHQSPWYPGTGFAAETGSGAGKGFTLNCPLPGGAGREEIFAAFEQQLQPAMEEFRPQLVLISAGFDSRANDPLGYFTLTDGDFADLTHWLMRLARRHCGGRIISLLEGGYNLDGLASAAVAHVKTLASASE
jgi:acetoin utilization deacetylase AcuC-like enzyme